MRFKIHNIILFMLIAAMIYQSGRDFDWSLEEVTSTAMVASATVDAHGNDTMDQTYRLAREESFGLFDRIQQEDWLRRKQLFHARNPFPDPMEDTKNDRFWPSHWYQFNWPPDFSCEMEDTVGGNKDGRKWVCDPHHLSTLPDCLVYSVGSNGDFTFELGIQKIAPNCEIHTFDMKDFSQKMLSDGVLPGKAFFHEWGLKSSYEDMTPQGINYTTHTRTFNQFGIVRKPSMLKKLRTIHEIQKTLGHVGRRIDLFKIDCEGCEWKSFRDWLSLDMRQILVELHEVPPIANEALALLRQHGYVIFHREPNVEFAGGNSLEYSFLKLSPKFTNKQ